MSFSSNASNVLHGIHDYHPPSTADLASAKTASRALHDAEETDEEWVIRLWNRMDRDRSGYITMAELNCEEFYNVMSAAIAPITGLNTGGASHSRVKVNVMEAIKLCMRKADANDDGILSFEEFRSLLLTLREPKLAEHSAMLVFALFDKNLNGRIDRTEFQELYRFLLGRNPTEDEFEAEWNRIASLQASKEGKEEVSQRAYVRWLQSSDNPLVLQQIQSADRASPDYSKFSAGGLHMESRSTSAGAMQRSRSDFSISANTRFAGLSASRSSGSSWRSAQAGWNQRFNCSINPGHINDVRPAGTREYFFVDQTKHELIRFWEAHDGNTFRPHLEALSKPAIKFRNSKLFPKVLSTEGGTPMTLPERHEAGGTMRSTTTDEVVQWEDNFVTPLRFRCRNSPMDRPLAQKATFGDINDSRLSGDVSPAALRKKRAQAEAKFQRRRRLGGPSRKTALEAEPW
eukprot:TRINITY_DN97950_c0_g1_i1.p1 TRINITY_DN97950_c0_g1~~TRINITY_DN97950_c0_g1_i1.p1  ORF type:complete len:477 (-),score=72.15 TRINITY_DN97950_c0_g1_i1:411-1790(-)